MNIQAFNANELDAIYDACIAHMYCTDDDSVADACHTIINKMHIFCTMNQDQEWIVRYKELRMNHT